MALAATAETIPQTSFNTKRRKRKVWTPENVRLLQTSIAYDMLSSFFALLSLLAYAATLIPFYVGKVFAYFGGEYLMWLFWGLSWLVILLGYMHLSVSFIVQGKKINGDKKFASKLTVLMLAFLLDFIPGTNVLPCLTFWTWYTIKNPE